MSKDNRVSKSDFKKFLKEFEWIKKNFDNYKRELDLIDEKNPYECELYSVIACVMRCCMHDGRISLRDVSAIRKSETINTVNLMSKNFMGKYGPPDFVILDKEYDNQIRHTKQDRKNPHEYGVFGAIEIKYMGMELGEASRGRIFFPCKAYQIKAHIRYFKKVIYTDGLTWQFYLFDDSKPNRDTRDIERDELIKEFVLGTIEGKEFKWNDEKVWKDLCQYLHEIDWRTPGKLGK